MMRVFAFLWLLTVVAGLSANRLQAQQSSAQSANETRRTAPAITPVLIGGQKYISHSDVRSYFGLTGQKIDGDKLELSNAKYSLIFRHNSQSSSFNNLRFVLSKPVIKRDGKFYISLLDCHKLLDPVLRPQYYPQLKRFNTVILDPGHGGSDAGATRAGVRESDLNLKLALLLRQKLQAAGFNVVMTRNEDKFLTLAQRVEIANGYNNAIFVSLHFNSAQPMARGIETFTLTPNGTTRSELLPGAMNGKMLGNNNDAANIALATALQNKTLRSLSADDRGIKRARYNVLCNVRHPAVLFVGGFVSNAAERQLISSPEYQQRMADALCEGIRLYHRYTRN